MRCQGRFYSLLCTSSLHTINLRSSRLYTFSNVFSLTLTSHRTSPLACSHKTLRTKKILAVAARKNRLLPQWIRSRTGNTVRYNGKRRQWFRNKVCTLPPKRLRTPRAAQAASFIWVPRAFCFAFKPCRVVLNFAQRLAHSLSHLKHAPFTPLLLPHSLASKHLFAVLSLFSC